ncbi:hypothetical protein KIN20_016626 [Parelaphostrongylus tenuis]|uniref:Uncharacterized protein n=1 Tax=Parelaphostrongylus tenuis TaxID=148309 RepID=A0AAD5MGQ8_PARTN|nr:hypothetical protein KIN20_016626 [Parelaphostrongylus tenuis]
MATGHENSFPCDDRRLKITRIVPLENTGFFKSSPSEKVFTTGGRKVAKFEKKNIANKSEKIGFH